MLKFAERLFFTMLFIFTAPSASAAIINLDADSRGWITQTDVPNGEHPVNNFVVGNCAPDACQIEGEYRNFFKFTLPAIADEVVSARLLLDTFDVDAQQSPSVTYGVFSTSSTASFADLGTGTLYGSRAYTDADDGKVLGIALNGAALADILASLGSNLTISGRVTSPTTFGGGAVNQIVFGFSSGEFKSQLELTTRDGQVPTPASLVLVIAALTALRWSRHKNSNRI